MKNLLNMGGFFVYRVIRVLIRKNITVICIRTIYLVINYLCGDSYIKRGEKYDRNSCISWTSR